MEGLDEILQSTHRKDAKYIRNVVNSQIPIELWTNYKVYDVVAYCCDLPMILKMIKFYEKYRHNILFTFAIYSIEYHNGLYLEHLIALGLDINRKFDYGSGTYTPMFLTTENNIYAESGIKNYSLFSVALVAKRAESMRILLRNGFDDIIIENKFTQHIKSVVSTNRRAARTLIGIRKFRSIYKNIDRFIFREIAISIWSSRDT